jgi:Tfp pilus assembly protein PilF
VYGPDHHQVAITLTNLGILHRVRGEHDQAADCFERAATVFVATFGPDHEYSKLALRGLVATRGQVGGDG